MPGMMETIPNLGLNPQTLEALTKETGDVNFVSRCYLTFLKKFAVLVQGVAKQGFDEIEQVEQNLGRRIDLFRNLIEQEVGEIVDDVWRQLEMAVEAVCRSWNTDRAKEYRRVNAIPENLGTAVVVQAMVFGNRDDQSGTGVAFSRNPITGGKLAYGEFLRKAQGDDLVGGTSTPSSLKILVEDFSEVAKQLFGILNDQDRQREEIVEVEFTVESGKLWLLQVRRAKTTIEADLQFAVDQVVNSKMTRRQAMTAFKEERLAKLVAERQVFEEKEIAQLVGDGRFLKGLPASPSVAQGEVCLSCERALERAGMGVSVILIRPDTSPDDFNAMIRSRAILTATGGATCHAAVVARGQGIPAVVGATALTENGIEWLKEGLLVSVDGSSGLVFPGLVKMAGSKPNQNAQTILGWIKEDQEKKVDFSLANKCWCMNTLLNDFYLSEAVLHKMSGMPMEDEVRHLTETVQREVSQVMATYLVIAVAGELRHALHYLTSEDKKQQVEILQRLEGSREDRAAAQSVVSVLQKDGPESIISFCRMAKIAFERGGDPAGYGGKRWATIALTVLQYLEGKFGARVFVDRAFDLRHNGGILFNKHSMVDRETREGTLQSQLDVKRHETDLERLRAALIGLWGAVSPKVAMLFAVKS
jgi:phosphohistidine swiveling domain-containing protein